MMDARTARVRAANAQKKQVQECLNKIMLEIEKAADRGETRVRVLKMDLPAKTSLERMGYKVEPYTTTDCRGDRLTDGWIIKW